MRTKAFVKVVPHTLGVGIHRVAQALKVHRPRHVDIVDNAVDADVVVVHIIGHGSLDGWAFRDDQKIGLVQYCLTTTEDSRPEAWLPIWQRASAVWSYYDIAKYCADRLVRADGPVNFYYAPLGIDGDVFQPSAPIRKKYAIGTSGYVAETEGVNECYAACRKIDRDLFHLGPPLGLGPGVTYASGISDESVAEFWSQCNYVAGLRRIEGFELPAYEGLACGARPLVFDAPHYRHWLGDLAVYVPEVGAEELTQAIVDVLSKPVRPVTPEERAHALERFDWRVLAGGFWEALL